jgi:hypothetical protein
MWSLYYPITSGPRAHPSLQIIIKNSIRNTGCLQMMKAPFKRGLQLQVSPTIVSLPKSTVVQYYVVDFSFWKHTFLCNLVSAVSLSGLLFWNSTKRGMPVFLRQICSSYGYINYIRCNFITCTSHIAHCRHTCFSHEGHPHGLHLYPESAMQHIPKPHNFCLST